MFTTVYDTLMLTNSESCSEPTCTVAIFKNVTQIIWFPLFDIRSSDPHNLEKSDLFDLDAVYLMVIIIWHFGDFYFNAKLNVRQHWLLVKQSTSISSCLPN